MTKVTNNSDSLVRINRHDLGLDVSIKPGESVEVPSADARKLQAFRADFNLDIEGLAERLRPIEEPKIPIDTPELEMVRPDNLAIESISFPVMVPVNNDAVREVIMKDPTESNEDFKPNSARSQASKKQEEVGLGKASKEKSTGDKAASTVPDDVKPEASKDEAREARAEAKKEVAKEDAKAEVKADQGNKAK